MATLSNLIAINVGNTRTHLGRFSDGELQEAVHFECDDFTPILQKIVGWWKEIAEKPQASIVLASVNESESRRLTSAVKDQLSVNVYRAGDDLPVPIGRQLDPETITGIDRLLNAAAAYDLFKQACVVVDVGTAITIDFIDGEGTFQGGAIAPGARLQLQSLHDHTSALPEIEFAAPNGEAFGRSTSQAMLQGVFHGIRGMVWKLIERYAEDYGAFPTIIATGGDADLIFKNDELIDQIVPDLTLQGIYVTAKIALAGRIDKDVDVKK